MSVGLGIGTRFVFLDTFVVEAGSTQQPPACR